jgi:glutathione synthase/RimK-type ligase-like ATP-grasp enzyme
VVQVAFATYQKVPQMVDDDRLVADVLQAKGISVTSQVWDDPAVDWSQFASVVIRSTWDYHHKVEQYADWLRRRASDGTKLWNPPDAVLANLNKQYLLHLADRGVKVVPTTYLTTANGKPLREVLESYRWDEAIVKPAISASAHGTWRTSLATVDADQSRFEEQSRTHEVLVQQYMSEVATVGEWSLVFFAGEYSHAALKRPAEGDFRVQRHFGGNSTLANPSSILIEQAREVLSKMDSPLLYARVDGVECDGQFVLMELETNEPYLFVGFSNGAAERFANAIEAVMS